MIDKKTSDNQSKLERLKQSMLIINRLLLQIGEDIDIAIVFYSSYWCERAFKP